MTYWSPTGDIIITVSVVITRSNVPRYSVQHCSEWDIFWLPAAIWGKIILHDGGHLGNWQPYWNGMQISLITFTIYLHYQNIPFIINIIFFCYLMPFLWTDKIKIARWGYLENGGYLETVLGPPFFPALSIWANFEACVIIWMIRLKVAIICSTKGPNLSTRFPS